jgi:hypothetical protein
MGKAGLVTVAAASTSLIVTDEATRSLAATDAISEVSVLDDFETAESLTDLRGAWENGP